MKRYFAACLLGALSLGAIAAPAVRNGWHVLQRWQIGGEGGWDYLAFDPATRHLYVSRSDRVVVLDVAGMPSMTKSSVIGEIDGLSGVHGIAIAQDLHRGFISNGRADTVTVFD